MCYFFCGIMDDMLKAVIMIYEGEEGLLKFLGKFLNYREDHGNTNGTVANKHVFLNYGRYLRKSNLNSADVKKEFQKL